jgi:hypothetical protein
MTSQPALNGDGGTFAHTEAVRVLSDDFTISAVLHQLRLTDDSDSLNTLREKFGWRPGL